MKSNQMKKYQEIKCFLGFHKLIPFKHCDKYLVAAYCKNCCTIKVGNPIYYDGTFYQRTLKKQKAIDFIKKEIDYVKSLFDRLKEYKKMGFDKNIINEIVFKENVDILENYESLKNLNNIKYILKSQLNTTSFTQSFDCYLCGFTFLRLCEPVLHYVEDEMDEEGYVSLCDNCSKKVQETIK